MLIDDACCADKYCDAQAELHYFADADDGYELMPILR